MTDQGKCPLTVKEIATIYKALKPAGGSISCQDGLHVDVSRPRPALKDVGERVEERCQLLDFLSSTNKKETIPCCCYPRITSKHQFTGTEVHARKEGVFLTPPILKIQSPA